jgi:hypothetical protein
MALTAIIRLDLDQLHLRRIEYSILALLTCPTLHMSTAEFGAYIKDEMTKWGPVVQKAGIKPE